MCVCDCMAHEPQREIWMGEPVISLLTATTSTRYGFSLNGEKFKGQFDLLQSFSGYRLEITFHLYS